MWRQPNIPRSAFPHSHKSNIVVIVHLHSRCEQRVSLTEDGPDDAHSLTTHQMVGRLETEVEIPKRDEGKFEKVREKARAPTCR